LGNTGSSLNIPGGDILFARLAQRLLESGDVEEATKICEKGLRKYPTYAQAHYILARCYMKQYKSDEARTELERVLRYDPNHVNAIKDLSSIYFINGFQDLYKEYLLKLFVLCPLNEEIIDEVKKLGDYEHWSPVPVISEIVKPKKVPPPAPKEAEAGKGTAEYAKPASVSVFPEKVDLSQFDNLQDDFTTILHGNLELPGKRLQFDSSDIELIKSREEIFAEENLLKEDQESDNDEELMDELLGDNEELVTKEIGPHGRPDDQTKEPEIIITGDQAHPVSSQKTKKGKETALFPKADNKPEKPIKEIKTEIIEIKEMPVAAAKAPETPVSDFNHLQDEEDSHFEQPKIISQTLGEILVSQQKYAEAKSVFEALKEKHPDNKSLDVKIAYLDRIIGLEKSGKS
jgi:tetratricopeptide (TPR) repeat protein